MRTIVFACALVCLFAAPAFAHEDPQGSPTPYEVPPLPQPPAPPATPAPPPPAPPADPPPPAAARVSTLSPVLVVAPAPAPLRDTPAPSAEPSRSFQLDVGVATDFPIFLGGYVGAELPGRILLQVGAGVMPSPYTSAVNGLLTGVGAYDATVGGLVQSALSNPFVLRLSAGWRPFPGHGLEIMGGYTLIHAEGVAIEGDVINAVLTEEGSSQRVQAGSGVSIPLTTNLHNVHVSLGWRWLAADDHLVIRASLSYIQCLAADMSASLPSQGQAMETTVNQALNSVVTPYFTNYVKAPLLGLSAAYRFY